MRPLEKNLLSKRQKYFVDDLCPIDLLPHLRQCLQGTDIEKIECDCKNHGDSRATQTLFERITRRGDDAFAVFVNALRKADYDNLAMILDPLYVVANLEPQYKSLPPVCTAGPAIDIRVTMRITNEGNKQINNDLEQIIVEEFKTQKSAQSKKLRKEFAKYLPQGATFLSTVSDTPEKSVQLMFRLSKVEAADKLWKLYQCRDLHQHLRDVLFRCVNKDKLSDVDGLKFDVNFLKDVHEDARQKLEAIESGQVDNMYPLQLEENGDSEIPRNPIILPDFKIPDVFLDNGKGQKAIDLKLRNYQKELAQPALAAHNTVICAPTNSGKTYVALQIARNHLDAMNGKGKVLFLVSTVNLVLQQRERFQLYLNDKYKVTEMSSAHTVGNPLEQKVKTNDVVVLTAQILVNALRDKKLKFHDISMLIFDECHHTHGEHPYNKTMEFYMTLKLQPGFEHSRLPQIIGMTASLGVGKARNVNEATDHIISLCANLDSLVISTVKEHKGELEEHTSTPKRTVYPVHRNRNNMFDAIINPVMENIEGYVANAPLKTEIPPTGRGSQRYRQWCETLYEDGVIAGNRYVVTYAEQLREYNIALSINDATRMKDAVARLRKYFDRLKEHLFTDVDRRLKTMFHRASDALEELVNKHGEPLNPKLEAIKKILLERMAEDSESKGILFSKTRETTIALENWIKETAELSGILKPLRLVGTNDGEGGMTQNDQEEVISKFQHGRECNLIIATTVAEEGLDISDCNYVIRYDMIGNEISSVQSRGRIRTREGGQYCSVIGADSGGLEKEQLNRYRECLMVEALAHVQEMDQNVYREKLADFQREAAKWRAVKERLQNCLKSKYDPNDVTFKCCYCPVVACQAHDIRRVKKSYHVVITDDFDDKIEKIDIPPSKVLTFHDISMTQAISCKRCGQHWGCIVNLKGLEMPCIKVESFVLEIKKGEGVTSMRRKKWKKCPFTIADVDIGQLLDLKIPE